MFLAPVKVFLIKLDFGLLGAKTPSAIQRQTGANPRKKPQTGANWKSARDAP